MPAIAFYSTAKPIIVSSDASSFVVNDVLLQQHPEGLKLVAYCSTTLTTSEYRYAKIETETMEVVWACEKSSLDNIRQQTDHKSITYLFNSYDLLSIPIKYCAF